MQSSIPVFIISSPTIVLVQMGDQNTVNQLIPRISPKRFGTRSVRADLCTVDCYTYCNKVEIHISTITTVAAPTTTTTSAVNLVSTSTALPPLQLLLHVPSVGYCGRRN